MSLVQFEVRRAAVWTPSVDVHEEEGRYVIRADLPGVDPKDIEITAENGVLTVRGERKADEAVEGRTYERRERANGGFMRRFTLPEDVQPDAIVARTAHGVLELTLPKQPRVMPRRIEVRAA